MALDKQLAGDLVKQAAENLPTDENTKQAVKTTTKVVEGVGKTIAFIKSAGLATVAFWIIVVLIAAWIIAIIVGVVSVLSSGISDPCANKTDTSKIIEGLGEENIPSWMLENTSDNCSSGSGNGFDDQYYPVTNSGSLNTYHLTGGGPVSAHPAADITAGCDTPVYAYAGGTIVTVKGGDINSFANMGFQHNGVVVIKHTESLYTMYVHMWAKDMAHLKVGDVVSVGDEISKVGDSGVSLGCHLHFQIHISDEEAGKKGWGLWQGLANLDGAVGAPLEYPATTHMKETGIADLYPMSPDKLPPKPEPKNGGSGDSTSDGDAQAFAKKEMKSVYGWGDGEFACLKDLWTRESGWNPAATNPSSGAYGIPQALPGSKMASAGSDWQTNPNTQVKWGLTYIQGRYGTPCSAIKFWDQNNWY